MIRHYKFAGNEIKEIVENYISGVKIVKHY
jgi:hypothetical protein